MPEGKEGREAMADFGTTWRAPAALLAAIILLGSMAASMVADPPGAPEAGERAEWKRLIRRGDEAAAQKDFRTADAALHDALNEAIIRNRWDGLLEVGHAYLRLGQAGGPREAMEMKAERAYSAALTAARLAESVDGVLRTAEAYAAMGKPVVVDQIVRLAEFLAARSRDAQAGARVRAFREGRNVWSLSAPGLASDQL